MKKKLEIEFILSSLIDKIDCFMDNEIVECIYTYGTLAIGVGALIFTIYM